MAYWNGSSWSGLGTGVITGSSVGSVFALQIDPTGNLLVGGWFVKAGGVSAINLATWNSSGGWASIGNGLNNGVFTLAKDSAGNCYAAGAFSAINNTQVAYHIFKLQ